MPTALFRPWIVRSAFIAFASIFAACATNDDVPNVNHGHDSGRDTGTAISHDGGTSHPCPNDQPFCDSGVVARPDVPSAMPDVPSGMMMMGGGDAGVVGDSGVLPMIPIVRDPPPIPGYSGGECPMLNGGDTVESSLNVGFRTGAQTRQFRVVVPRNRPNGSGPMPVVFAWHWISASSASWFSNGELALAAEQLGFIAVLPDSLRDAGGNRVYQLNWPYAEPAGIPGEIQFFRDMLSCVNRRFPVDPRRVYGIGVSDGALWMTYLSTTAAADHFAAVETISGGLGTIPGLWEMQYVPQTNKFPTLVLWGGPTDNLGINFDLASRRYRDALRGDNHFVVQCMHNSGHGIPPLPPGEMGMTRYRALYQFLLDHPYGMAPGDSPYARAGRVPAFFPAFCSIAM